MYAYIKDKSKEPGCMDKFKIRSKEITNQIVMAALTK